MHEGNIAANRQERPEHQKILRRRTVHLQLIVHPVKQRIRTDALIRRFPRAFSDQFITMTVCAGIVAVRSQPGKPRQQDDDHQGADDHPVSPIGVYRPDSHMIGAPGQRNRYEHENY